MQLPNNKNESSLKVCYNKNYQNNFYFSFFWLTNQKQTLWKFMFCQKKNESSKIFDGWIVITLLPDFILAKQFYVTCCVDDVNTVVYFCWLFNKPSRKVKHVTSTFWFLLFLPFIYLFGFQYYVMEYKKTPLFIILYIITR